LKVVVLSSYAESLVNIRGPLIVAMTRAGHRVVACAPEKDANVVATLNQWGVDFEQVALRRTGMNPILDCVCVASLVRFLRKHQPDVFLSYNIKSVIYGLLAARLAGVPRRFALMSGLGYTFLNETVAQRAVNLIARALYRLALPNAHAVFFQNPDDRETFKLLGLVRADQAVLINGSGVDFGVFAEAPPVTDQVVFLLIARLIKDKGIIEYVEAARVLKQRFPHLRFQLLGRFDTNPSAIKREQVEEWQRSGLIEYLGATMNVHPFLSAASVYVLPSYREGTPLTVLEAMATGRPIVTTDVPGCRETVINGQNGFLVPAKDIPALVRAMERFVLDPFLISAMGARSRQIAVDKYDVRKVNAVIMRTTGLQETQPLDVPIA
jgi:glycosyltransferase involved in cell wall biosynthesis